MKILRFRSVRVSGLWVALAVLLVLTSACGGKQPTPILEQDMPPTPEFDTVEMTPDEQQVPAGGLEPLEQSDCPDLDSLLLQLIQASDPSKAAEELQLKVEGSKVQVLLILGSEDTEFLQDFEVEVGTQSGTQVQAFVPIDQLCDLANTDEVLAIRAPAQAVSE